MKIKRLLFTLLSFLFLITACDFFNGEEGLVVLKLAGASRQTRSLDSLNGNLPYLSDCEFKIIAINKSSGEKIEKDIDAGSAKAISLPIGESFIIKIKINNEIGIWSGETEHTVSSGTNEVNVKIKRNACGFRPIGFTVDIPSPPPPPPPQQYTLYTPSGNPIVDASGVLTTNPTYAPMFCPNNKGGLYMAKNTGGSGAAIYIASSEGNFDPSISVPITSNNQVYDLAYDYKTGETYLVWGNGVPAGSTPRSIRIITKDYLGNLSPDEVKTISNGKSLISVYNNIIFFSSEAISPGSIECYKVQKDTSSSTPTYSTSDISVTTNTSFNFIGSLKDSYPISTNAKVEDVFVNDKYVYILLSDIGQESLPGGSSHPILTKLNAEAMFGCILKMSYKLNGGNIEINNGQVFGLGSLSPSSIPSNGILLESYYANNFYKPIKFIGFDGDNLYIADDGARPSTVTPPASPVNRIATFNLADESLSFKTAPAGVKWGDGL